MAAAVDPILQAMIARMEYKKRLVAYKIRWDETVTCWPDDESWKSFRAILNNHNRLRGITLEAAYQWLLRDKNGVSRWQMCLTWTHDGAALLDVWVRPVDPFD